LADGVQIPHLSTKSMSLTKDGGHMHIATPSVAQTNNWWRLQAHPRRLMRLMHYQFGY
jgi:hypothetical protein